jgi:hypothetical protein
MSGFLKKELTVLTHTAEEEFYDALSTTPCTEQGAVDHTYAR